MRDGTKIDCTEQLGPTHGQLDGYRASRNRITSALERIRNGVVLTGAEHRQWTDVITENSDRPESLEVGVELIATSATSSADGADASVLAENPHLRFYQEPA